VTGGCGYIGSHVTRQLSEAGYRVTVIDDLSRGFPGSLLHGERLVEGDIRDSALLDRAFASGKFSAVLHFAASIVVPDSVARPLEYYDNNTLGTLRLLQACQKHQVRQFVFSSTAAVYGEREGGPLTEDSPVAPSNPYGRSKLIDEWILGDVALATALRYVALRYFNVAGADPRARIGQRSVATHLIKVACEAALGKRPEVVIFGTDYRTPDGTGVRDYIHVEDLAGAHLDALGYLEKAGESRTFNCGYGRGYSVKEVLEEVRRQAGDFRIRIGPRRAGDVSQLVADSSALRKTLGWKPKYANLSDIIQHALAFEKTLPR